MLAHNKMSFFPPDYIVTPDYNNLNLVCTELPGSCLVLFSFCSCILSGPCSHDTMMSLGSFTVFKPFRNIFHLKNPLKVNIHHWARLSRLRRTIHRTIWPLWNLLAILPKNLCSHFQFSFRFVVDWIPCPSLLYLGIKISGLKGTLKII